MCSSAIGPELRCILLCSRARPSRFAFFLATGLLGFRILWKSMHLFLGGCFVVAGDSSGALEGWSLEHSCLWIELDLFASLLLLLLLSGASGLVYRVHESYLARMMVVGRKYGAMGRGSGAVCISNRARPSRGALSLAIAPLGSGFAGSVGICQQVRTMVSGIRCWARGHSWGTLCCSGELNLPTSLFTSAIAPLELWLKCRDTQRLVQVDCGLEDVLWGR